METSRSIAGQSRASARVELPPPSSTSDAPQSRQNKGKASIEDSSETSNFEMILSALMFFVGICLLYQLFLFLIPVAFSILEVLGLYTSRILQAINKELPMIQIPYRSPTGISRFIVLTAIFFGLVLVLEKMDRNKEMKGD